MRWIAISVFSSFLTKSDMDIKLVVFDKKSFVLSSSILSDVDAYIDENYVEEILDEEYAIDRARMNMASARASMTEPEKPSFFGALGLKRKSSKKDVAAFEEVAEPEIEACEEAAEEENVILDEVVFEALAEPKLRSLDDLDSQVSDTWQEMLLRLIDEKGLKPSEVYKGGNIDKKLFSKIKNQPDYQPKKITAIAFCIGLRLNIDETKDFLSRAGYALSPSSKFDLIVRFYIEKGNYDLFELNEVLFDYGQELIGKFD
ncbi:MAG: hypothetical protein IKQ97_04485 [Eubacterium sp.]|nr:hypothetical protein [Eubacterium sp.]